MSSLFKTYTKLLNRFPKTCQSVQTGILMGTGDVVSQTFAEKKHINDIDFTRTAQFFCIGAVVVGPSLMTWYTMLQNNVGKSGKVVALKKVAIDQLLFSPICNFFILGAIHAIQGNNITEIKQLVEKEYFYVLATNYKIWPAVQLVNFYFVPLNYQVLLVQVVSIFWNAFLSYTTRPNKE